MMDSTGVLVTAGLTALSASVSYQINQHIPEPYMDEIFHIPQAQKYCQGDFFHVSLTEKKQFKNLVKSLEVQKFQNKRVLKKNRENYNSFNFYYTVG